MLCTKLSSLVVVCSTALSGGVSRVWIFDPADFDFTQTAPTTGNPPNPYTVVALVSPSTGKMYPVKFNVKECEYRYAQSRKGRSTSYEHTLEFNVADISQTINNWNGQVDAASCCGGIGLIIQLNSGRILVAGEGVVNGDPVDIKLEMYQDGSTGTSGKLYDDANQQVTILKGGYNRGLYEFTGGLAAITALE